MMGPNGFSSSEAPIAGDSRYVITQIWKGGDPRKSITVMFACEPQSVHADLVYLRGDHGFAGDVFYALMLQTIQALYHQRFGT